MRAQLTISLADCLSSIERCVNYGKSDVVLINITLCIIGLLIVAIGVIALINSNDKRK